MATIRITTTQNIDIEYEVASLGDRILARLIDLAIFILIIILFVIASSYMNGVKSSEMGVIILIVIFSVLFVFYDLICEIFMNGQSVGKRVMKIKVISLDGNQPTVGQYLLRWLFRIFDFFLPGVAITGGLVALISVAVTPKQQRLGDMVAGTTLIKTTLRTQIDHVAFIPEPAAYEPMFKEAATLSEHDMALIQDVINTYMKTKNAYLVQNMAIKIREHLGVSKPEDMNDMKFLQTVMKDYAHIAAQIESL